MSVLIHEQIPMLTETDVLALDAGSAGSWQTAGFLAADAPQSSTEPNPQPPTK